jgi:hypothetical protein
MHTAGRADCVEEARPDIGRKAHTAHVTGTGGGEDADVLELDGLPQTMLLLVLYPDVI